MAKDTCPWLFVWEGCIQAYKDSMEGVPISEGGSCRKLAGDLRRVIAQRNHA
ncbi:hypothetical protein [Streptomyces sp. NPDC055134]